MALKRVVTLREALAINIGAIIGAGIFAISGLAAGIAGPSVIVAILIGAVVATLTGLSYAQLASVYSKEGGNYAYSKILLGSYAGTVVGLMFIVASMVGGAVVALSFGSYFTSLFGISVGLPVVAAALIVILGIVNYFGVKHSAQASVILTVAKVGILILFIIVGVLFIKPSRYVPFLPNGFGSLFEASAFIFFAYTGFARVTAIGEEVKDPKRTIPKAIIYSILISALLYALTMVVLIGIVPYGAVSTSAAPLEYAITYAAHNALIGYIIAVGALFATINVVLSMILGVSRVTFAMSRDNDLPKFLAKLNRFGAPDNAILMSTLVMLVAIFAFNFKQIASLSNATALLSYAIANIAAMKLVMSGRRNARAAIFKSKYFVLIPILGVVSAFSLLFFLTRTSLYIIAAVLVLITIYYMLKPEAEKGSRST